MIDARYNAYLLDASLAPVKVESIQGDDNYLFIPD